ncbi:unnamed protein product, partial [Larinioides sclopetarius]
FTNNLILNEDSRFGFSSNLCLQCKNCSFVKGFSSTAKVNNKNILNTLVVSSVIAAFYHSYSSTKQSMHGQCPEGASSWCKYQQAMAQRKTFHEKAIGLPQNIINIIKPVYMELCDQSLLKECLHGMTQNANESFNGLLWNIVPKQHFNISLSSKHLH